MKLYYPLLALFFVSISCISTKSTLKNVDDTAPTLRLNNNNAFVVTQYSKDKRYGYNKDYPINVFYQNTRNDSINQQRFLNALVGPKGETITFKKLQSCCPFPSKKTDMGAGFLDVYELSWQGLKTPITLYFNIYEKGYLFVPMGLRLKNDIQKK